jgi:hypothetical protein
MSSHICFSIFSPSFVIWFILNRYYPAVNAVKLELIDCQSDAKCEA